MRRGGPDFRPITCMWAAVDTTGLERFQSTHAAGLWTLQGTILRLHAGQAIEARYQIRSNSDWQTLGVKVEVWNGTESRTLELENHQGSWSRGGQAVPQFDGCMDIDLGWTPSTNTLPIRRLDLAGVDRAHSIDAAWVRFPELTLERLQQSYEPLGGRRYRYVSGGGVFRAEIVVDEHGVVDEYKGYWKRIL